MDHRLAKRSAPNIDSAATKTPVDHTAGTSAMAQSCEVREYIEGPQGAQVQARAPGPLNGSAAQIHETAKRGVSGGQGLLPHLAAIQASFGPHFDISGVGAHVGGAAAQANERLGSAAYTRGEQVAFKSVPDLHTAAHEAAHVVQQRHGVQLSNGVGRVGDRYERQADAIADRVVQGRSATDLLQAGGSASQSDPAVEALQHAGGKTKAEKIEYIANKVKNPKDSTLRSTYEAAVAAFETEAEAGVKKLGISLEAYRAAKESRGAVPLPAGDDAKLESLAKTMIGKRLDLSTRTKHLTLRPLLYFIFQANLKRYPTKYGPTYDSLRADGKTHAQIIGGSYRYNPDINAFLSPFKSWLETLSDDVIDGYYNDALNDRCGE